MISKTSWIFAMCNEIKADRIAHLYALVIVQLRAKVLIKFVMPSRFCRNTMRRMTKVAQCFCTQLIPKFIARVQNRQQCYNNQQNLQRFISNDQDPNELTLFHGTRQKDPNDVRGIFGLIFEFEEWFMGIGHIFCR